MTVKELQTILNHYNAGDEVELTYSYDLRRVGDPIVYQRQTKTLKVGKRKGKVILFGEMR